MMQRWVLIVGFLVFGVVTALSISRMLYEYPLFDFAVTDINWTREWLFTTILDYYGVAFCLSAIAIASEDVPYGFLWAMGFCLLGSPVACLYLVVRLLFKSIALRGRDLPKHNGAHEEGVAMLRSSS